MIQVRRAEVSDRDTLVEFQIRLAKESEGLDLDRAKVTKGVQAVFDKPSLGAYWVARSGEHVVACLLTLPEWSDWRNGTVVWIHSVYVLPEFRRRGVFRRMYETLRDQVQTSKDLMGLRLYVDKRNTSAQQAYKRLGMDSQHYDLFEWVK
jgi:GNAT superfamily N-acetyltransferase